MLGVFDGIGALDDQPRDEQPVDRPEDREVTRRAASEAAVLLANRGVLPLAAGALRRVAVLGRNAEHPGIMGGGSATVLPHHVLSPLEALRRRLGDGVEVVYEAGEDEAGIERAVALTQGADAVVVIVGTNSTVETEGVDRESMDLPGRQDDLVWQIVRTTRDAVVVVNTGSPVTMPWADAAGAVLQTWFAGQELRQRPRRRAPRRGRAGWPAAHHPAAPARAFARLRQLPRGEQRGPLRRGSPPRLSLVRGAPPARALPLRPRPLLHDLRDRQAEPVELAPGSRRAAAGRGRGDQHRDPAGLGGRAALRCVARRWFGLTGAASPGREGAPGLHQGAPGPGRIGDRHSRAGRAGLRLLRRRRRGLAGAGEPPAQSCRPYA